MSAQKSKLFTIISITSFFTCFSVRAVCPLCVVAVGAGVGLSRFFGVPDVVTGVWLGGLLSALALWVVALLHKTRFNRPILLFPVFVLTYLSMLVTVWVLNLFGHNHASWGHDCLGLGILVGSLSFLGGVVVHGVLKYYHQNTVYFYFQKLVIPVVCILLASVFMYVIWR